MNQDPNPSGQGARENQEYQASEEGHRQAGGRMLALIDQVRVRPDQPAMSLDEVEQMIDAEVKAVRRAPGACRQS